MWFYREYLSRQAKKTKALSDVVSSGMSFWQSKVSSILRCDTCKIVFAIKEDFQRA